MSISLPQGRPQGGVGECIHSDGSVIDVVW